MVAAAAESCIVGDCAPCNFGFFNISGTLSPCDICPPGAACFGQYDEPKAMAGFYQYDRPELGGIKMIGNFSKIGDRVHFVACSGNQNRAREICRGPRELDGTALVVPGLGDGGAWLWTTVELDRDIRASSQQSPVLRLGSHAIDALWLNRQKKECPTSIPAWGVAAAMGGIGEQYTHCYDITDAPMDASNPKEANGPMRIWIDENDRCATGYQGKLCAKCAPGYGLSLLGKCNACHQGEARYLLLIVIFAVYIKLIDYLVADEMNRAVERVNQCKIEIKEKKKLWSTLKSKVNAARTKSFTERRNSLVTHAPGQGATKVPHVQRFSAITKVVLSYFQVFQLGAKFGLSLPGAVESYQQQTNGDYFYGILNIGCTIFGDDYVSSVIWVCVLPLLLFVAAVLRFKVWKLYWLKKSANSEIPNTKSGFEACELGDEVADGQIDAFELPQVLNKLKKYSLQHRGKSSLDCSTLQVHEIIVQCKLAKYTYNEGSDSHVFEYRKIEGIKIDKFPKRYTQALDVKASQETCVALLIIFFLTYGTVSSAASVLFIVLRVWLC
jgi:hypothetical protein